MHLVNVAIFIVSSPAVKEMKQLKLSKEISHENLVSDLGDCLDTVHSGVCIQVLQKELVERELSQRSFSSAV